MKKYTLIKLILILSLFGYVNSSFKKYDCSSFKTGKYIVKAKEATTYISRKEGYQIEYTPAEKIKIKSKITWISDCEYYISDYKILENPNNIDLSSVLGGKKIYFKILKANKRFVKTVATIKGTDFKLKIKYLRV